ncbi:hypothetical protein H4R33_002438 [Dimargaris cristalligena]|nr:hypothetical protein H4R33_002438 [Dimargaris cristalligena]
MTTMPESPTLSELRTYQFQNISNFRDVACSINESSKEIHIDPAKRVHLKPRMLFRSAKPDYASDEDLIRITKKIGIRTILDLRSEVEGDDQQTPWFNSFPLATATVLGGPLVDAPSIKNYSSASDLLEPPPPPIPPRPSSSSSSYSAPWETKRGSYGSDSLTLTSSGGDVESDAESMSTSTVTNSAVDGPSSAARRPNGSYTNLRADLQKLSLTPAPVRTQKRYNVNLIGSRFRYGFVWKSASLSTKSKLAYYQLRGMKQQMLDTVGKDIFKNIGLQGFYAGLLCYSGKEIARAIKIFSNLDNYPILVHCSHGKDRTGIIIALLLSLLGVDDRLIVDDYAKTREGMKDKLDEVKSDMRGTGMPDSFADAPPEAMRETMKHLRRIYRSTSYYLELIGISQRRQQRIIRNLTVYTEHDLIQLE